MQFNNDKYKKEAKAAILTELNAEPNLLHLVIKELIQNHEYEKILVEASKKYQIKQYNILNLSPSKAIEIYKSLKTKFYSQPVAEISNDQWCDNELRLFIWLFVCYLFVFKKSFDDMTKKDWLQFSDVFKNKTHYLFQYQARIIKKTNKKTKKWYSQQDQCLSTIIKTQSTLLRSINSYKWSQIAKKLFINSSKKYFRTPKQCRERWINHLDPEKVKSKWTLTEDCTLIGYVIKEGKKWAQIAKLMNNTRTQHMVKNRYNSLLKTELKKFQQMADQARVIKKLHYRLKYAYQSKNCQKDINYEEQKEKQEKEENQIHELSFSENKLDDHIINFDFENQLLSQMEETIKDAYKIRTFEDLIQIYDNIGSIQDLEQIKQQENQPLFQLQYSQFI